MDQGKPKSAKPAGRIKSGEGTLIGNAGEFYVAAELLKRGVIRSARAAHAPAFDILAAKGRKTVRVPVKTKSAEYTDWQWMVKKDGSIFRDLGQEDDFTVLVDLTPETKDLGFFVVPTRPSILPRCAGPFFEVASSQPLSWVIGRIRSGISTIRNLASGLPLIFMAGRAC